MTARPQAHEALLETYVLDVTRRLPRRMRNDVAFELRALLNESLRDRAADSGRLPDETLALEIVRAFGRPDDVAARYHSPGDPIIPAAHSNAFAWATLIGLVLQWAGSLPLALSGQLFPDAPESARLGAWWTSYGLGAFWWPGFLVTVMMAASWVRKTWPPGSPDWIPAEKFDRDHINRAVHLMGLGLAIAGIAMWVFIAWVVTAFDTPFTRALSFAPDFLATRAPLVLLLWAAGVSLLVMLIVEGRWRDLTRRVDVGIKIAACILMAWFVFGGRVFMSDAADQTVKGALVLIILLVVGQIALHLWRLRNRIRMPVVQQG
jgi:hypothetical protein